MSLSEVDGPAAVLGALTQPPFIPHLSPIAWAHCPWRVLAQGGVPLSRGFIESRGLRLDPVMTGIINAAVRQGVTYGLPMDTVAPSRP